MVSACCDDKISNKNLLHVRTEGWKSFVSFTCLISLMTIVYCWKWLNYKKTEWIYKKNITNRINSTSFFKETFLIEVLWTIYVITLILSIHSWQLNNLQVYKSFSFSVGLWILLSLHSFQHEIFFPNFRTFNCGDCCTTAFFKLFLLFIF